MAINSNFTHIALLKFPAQIQTVEELHLEALEALIAKAQEVPSEHRQQQLDPLKEHASDILRFLDYLEAQGEIPFEIMRTARLLFGELREIGVQLLQATDRNRSQISRGLSTYEPFRNFQVSLRELSPPKKRHTPTFKELLSDTGHAISEDHVQQNIALARLVGGAIRAGTTLAVEGAIMGACNINPVASMSCKAIKKLEAEAGHPIQQAFAQMASLQPTNQALSLELYSQYGIPLEEGRQYGEDALEVGLTLIPFPAALGGCRSVPHMLKARSFAQLMKEDAGSMKWPWSKKDFKKSAETEFVGRNGILGGSLSRFGMDEEFRIYFQETSTGMFTFNVNLLEGRSGQSADAVLKVIREKASGLNPKEVRIQWENTGGRDLLEIQAAKGLQPVGKMPSIMDSTLHLHTFILEPTHSLERELALRALPYSNISSFPAHLPQEFHDFVNLSEVKKLHFSKLGPEGKGYIRAKVLHLVLPESRGRSVVYHLGKLTPEGAFEKVGNKKLLFSAYIDSLERHRSILRSLFEHSRLEKHQRVFLLFQNPPYAPLLPIMQAIETLPEQIVGTAKYSRGLNDNPMMLLEINVNP